MTPDQRFWRLLTLLEDYYTTGERTAGAPPAVRFPRPRRAPPAAPAPGPAARAAGPPGAVRARSASGAGRPARPGGGAGEHAAPPPPAPERGAGEDSLPRVAAEVAACRACGLCAGRANSVPGEGAAQPLVMVVGEGPGREEDRSGRPFVGPAGQYLDRWLAAIDLRRDANCFITNVVKCRPPDNRDPQPDESRACRPFLQRQIRLLRPRALLSLGRIASQALTGRPAPLGALRGRVHHYQIRGLPHALPLVATYHPSAVLRDSSLRRPVWDDLRVLERLLAAGSGPPPAAVAEPE